MNRRSFLQLTAVLSAGPVVACSDGGKSLPVDRGLFPHSVASGDPRPDAVVLWTRAVNPDQPAVDVMVSVDVATDDGFSQIVATIDGLVAQAAHDHVIKVKITNLAARTDYRYRFRSTRNGATVTSPVGRTRTAPTADQAVKVRLAFASCQDFNGRYYNSWQQLADRDEDLDFVMFIGDYVYETAGAGAPAERQVVFSEPAGALSNGAAQSLSNYRDLYRAVRSDLNLQRLHERYPFLMIWDDHEFSDDCWGAHATYTNGATDELEPDRRRNSEQAFFEWLPIDLPPFAAAGPIDVGAAPLYPNARIYRDLTFGANLRVVLTDYRSYRPDHLVPEDAYPGALFLSATDLDTEITAGRAPAALKDRVATDAFAAVDVDAPALAAVKAELLAAALDEAAKAGVPADQAAARAAAVVKGPLAIAHVNSVLMTRAKPALLVTPAADQPHGFSFFHLGKRAWFSAVGARYVLVEDLFEVYAAALFARSAGASERAYGQAQDDWLSGLLAAPRDHGWTVMASSVSMTKLVLDLTGKGGIPAELQARYLFDGDQWDGFPNAKAALLARLQASGGGRALVVAGDIHAAYASVEAGVPCLTTPAISSATAAEAAAGAVAGYGLDPNAPDIALLVFALDGLFQQANPAIVLSDTHSHGVVLLDVDADAAQATYLLLPATEVKTSYAARSQDLRALVKTRIFQIEPGKITAV